MDEEDFKKKKACLIIRNYLEDNNLPYNLTDDEIYEIVRGKNSYWNSENSNKNPELASTQRDYIAGAVSKDTSLLSSSHEGMF